MGCEAGPPRRPTAPRTTAIRPLATSRFGCEIVFRLPPVNCHACEAAHDWLTTPQEKLIKIGAKVVGHARCVAFQMAEVAISKNLFADILRLLAELRPPPAVSTA